MIDRQDHFEDRLMDQALEEKLGGKSPPDLSEKIVTRHESDVVQTADRTAAVRRRRWWSLVIAASLLIAVGVVATQIDWSERIALLGDKSPAGVDEGATGQLPDSDAAADIPAVEPEEVPGLVDELETKQEAGEREKAARRKAIATLQAAENSLQILEDEDHALRDRIITVQKERDEQVGRVVSVTERIRQEQKEIRRLEEHREQLITGVARTTKILKAKGVNEIDQPMAHRPDEGVGPGRGGDKFDKIVENPYIAVKTDSRSTFSIDVDTAAYSKVRQYLMENRTMPPPAAVRIEELINYFTYDYDTPTGEHPFEANVETAQCPWKAEHRLVRIGIKGREIEKEGRPSSNLVFLLDVSGSMNRPNKLPLLKRGMKMLVDQLGENDRVAIAVYASSSGLVLDSTPCDEKQTILDALDRLRAGGSTAGGAGIKLAYQVALDNFIKGGTNRVILCTDGDFNVGTTSTAALVDLVAENAKAGIFLSVMGFGMGNHNDAMLEQISNKGNGNYAFIDNEREAQKVLVEQMSGTLVTIAKDVKIQIEFNPTQVAAFRLLGYENRILAHQDFNDDKKDAGEIGAGHTVTALYEIVPVGVETDADIPKVDDLKYQKTKEPSDAAESGELLTLKLRYKQPDGDTSTLMSIPVTDSGNKFGAAGRDFKHAAAVAAFGMLLRDSKHKGNATFAAVAEIAGEAAEDDASGYRAEFLKMVQQAKELAGK